MNNNKLYFIQVQKATCQRQCFLVSSPTLQEAQRAVAPYIDLKKDMIISSDKVDNAVDTRDEMNGKSYVKEHN